MVGFLESIGISDNLKAVCCCSIGVRMASCFNTQKEKQIWALVNAEFLSLSTLPENKLTKKNAESHGSMLNPHGAVRPMPRQKQSRAKLGRAGVSLEDNVGHKSMDHEQSHYWIRYHILIQNFSLNHWNVFWISLKSLNVNCTLEWTCTHCSRDKS